MIDDADVPKFIHSINLCEVFYNLLRHQGAEEADQAMNDLAALGIMQRHGLALGDACGVALARRLDADFITADHPEMEPVQAAGLGGIIFIR